MSLEQRNRETEKKANSQEKSNDLADLLKQLTEEKDPDRVSLRSALHSASSREKLEQDVLARDWKDNGFRQEFLTNPKAVLERDYPQHFPEGKIPSELTIQVIEEEEQTIYFVLPSRPSKDPDRVSPRSALHSALSREELEQDVRAKAWKDDGFRQEFLTNPKAVLERDYPQYFPEGKIPSELSFQVIKEEEQAICFVLPSKSSKDHIYDLKSIDDQELSILMGEKGAFTVHGGTGCVTCNSCICCIKTCMRVTW